MSKRKGRLPFLYLIARGPRPDYHRAPYHPVIVCDRRSIALWEAGDTGDQAWVWRGWNNPHIGWLLSRWKGLDIDYGHVVHPVPLPDGTPTSFYHATSTGQFPYMEEFFSLFRGAVWWSDREIPEWLQERGVIYPPDRFTRQRILDNIANDGHSGFGDRVDPPFWPPCIPDEEAGYLP